MADFETISHCIVSAAIVGHCTYGTLLYSLSFFLLPVVSYSCIYIYLRVLVEICFFPLPWLLSDIAISYKLVVLGTSTHFLALPGLLPLISGSDHLTVLSSRPRDDQCFQLHYNRKPRARRGPAIRLRLCAGSCEAITLRPITVVGVGRICKTSMSRCLPRTSHPLAISSSQPTYPPSQGPISSIAVIWPNNRNLPAFKPFSSRLCRHMRK